MTIGSTIKQLRRKADMTQEELAEILGISASAISQWETDRVLPDVTQIPVLTEIFKVSADVILGIDRERSDEKIKEILAAAEEAAHNTEFERAAEILRGAYRQYPRSYAVMERLAEALVNEYSRKGIREYGEVFRLCNTILDECTDSALRYQALDLLVTAYDYAGMQDKMLETAEQMPPFANAKESSMLWRWSFEKEDGLRKRQKYLSELLTELVMTLSLIAGHMHEDHTRVYSDDDRTAIFTQIVTIIETLFPDGDYQIMAQTAESACGDLADICLRRGDSENAVCWIEKGSDFAIHFDTYDFDAKHTSPALRGYEDGGWIMENGTNDSARMLDWLENSPESAAVRENERVQAVIERLKKTAVRPETCE